MTNEWRSGELAVSWLSSEECSAVGSLHTSNLTLHRDHHHINTLGNSFRLSETDFLASSINVMRTGQFKIFKLFLFSLLPPLTVRL